MRALQVGNHQYFSMHPQNRTRQGHWAGRLASSVTSCRHSELSRGERGNIDNGSRLDMARAVLSALLWEDAMVISQMQLELRVSDRVHMSIRG